MITRAFTWYSHPLTHTVGRTCVPHVLRWGGVVWARRGIWSAACVPASISHSVNITRQDSLPQVSYNPHSKLTSKRKICSPEKGILQVQEITGLWSCLIHLGNNTDVIALSVGRMSRNEDICYYSDQPWTWKHQLLLPHWSVFRQNQVIFNFLSQNFVKPDFFFIVLFLFIWYLYITLRVHHAINTYIIRYKVSDP